jgi:hypothetical protein
VPALGAGIFLFGCVTFVLWSQVIGSLILLPGTFVLGMWGAARYGFDNDPLAAVKLRRWRFFAGGLVLAAAGWALFFMVDGDLGLLAVVLGGLLISTALIGVREDSRGGPVDGPWFGETNA